MDTALYMVPAAWAVSAAPMAARVALVRAHGKLDNRRPRDRLAQTEGMAPRVAALCDRLLACHHNQLETLGWFSAGVAAAAATGVRGDDAAALASGYVATRVVYTLAYAAPQVAAGAFRSLAFVGSMSYVVRLYFAAARAAAGAS